MDLVINEILPSILIAVVTAVITVRLSFGRFRSERWWVKKEEAYSQIIEALYNVNVFFSWVRRLEEGQEEPNPRKAKEAIEPFNEAMGDLTRAFTVGEFLISRKATELLGRFISEHGDPSEVLADIDAKQAAVEETLSHLTALAREDLHVD
jgi:hypothetical protein